MTMPDEKKYTAAEMREAYVQGFVRRGRVTMGQAIDESRIAYPDPAPPLRWVEDGGSGDEVARSSDGKWWWRQIGSTDESELAVDDSVVRARFMLLPREPVTIPKAQAEMPQALRSAIYRWSTAKHGWRAADAFRDIESAYRAALSAVAADLVNGGDHA
jgi:hypothetical protein